MRRSITLASLLLTALLGPLAGASQAEDEIAVTKVDYLGGNLVLVSGTVTCPEGHWFDLYINLYQQSGRSQVTGWGWASGSCDGSAQAFQAAVHNDSHVAFRRGKATVSASGWTYGQCYEEDYDYYCESTSLTSSKHVVRIR